MKLQKKKKVKKWPWIYKFGDTYTLTPNFYTEDEFKKYYKDCSHYFKALCLEIEVEE